MKPLSVIGWLGFCFFVVWAAIRVFRMRGRIGDIQATFLATLMGKMAFDFLYQGVFYLLHPEYRPDTTTEKAIANNAGLLALVFPLYMILAAVYLFYFFRPIKGIDDDNGEAPD